MSKDDGQDISVPSPDDYTYFYQFIYFEDNTEPGGWRGGVWQLVCPNGPLPIRVVLVPVEPLTFRDFETRRPEPKELDAHVIRMHHIDLKENQSTQLVEALSLYKRIFVSMPTEGSRLRIPDQLPTGEFLHSLKLEVYQIDEKGTKQ